VRGGHTPGPWKTGHSDPWSLEHERTGNVVWVGIKAKSKVIGVAMTIGHYDDEEYQANARIMSAAPDLLKALTDLEVYLRLTPHHNAIEAAAARKAIAKATGK
jgi:hypothetical protein